MEFKPEYKTFNLGRVEFPDNSHRNFEYLSAFGKEKTKWHNLGTLVGGMCSGRVEN